MRCHEWRGTRMPNGYGQIHRNGKTAYAHRVAWELKHGPITDGLYVLHRCDNRRCVNPDHLFLGTFDENMADMVAKRRQAHSSRNGHAKLSENDVREIRSSNDLQAVLAKRFGVSQSIVSMVRSGKIWRYVEKI